MAPKQKTNKTLVMLVIIIACIVLAAVIWVKYFKKEDSGQLIITDNSSATSPLVDSANQEQAKVLRAIETLKKLKLDTSFFETSGIRDLQDITIEVVIPPKTERQYPFLAPPGEVEPEESQ